MRLMHFVVIISHNNRGYSVEVPSSQRNWRCFPLESACLPACLRLAPTACVFPPPFPRLLVVVYLCQCFRSYNTLTTLKFHLSFDDVSRFHPRYFCVKFHHLPLFQISVKSLFLLLLVWVCKIFSRSRKIFQLYTVIFRNFVHDFNNATPLQKSVR